MFKLLRRHAILISVHRNRQGIRDAGECPGLAKKDTKQLQVGVCKPRGPNHLGLLLQGAGTESGRSSISVCERGWNREYGGLKKENTDGRGKWCRDMDNEESRTKGRQGQTNTVQDD